MIERTFKISGRVNDTEGNGIPGLLVEIQARRRSRREELGSAITGEDGTFEQVYQGPSLLRLFKLRPAVRIAVRDVSDTVLHQSSEIQVAQGAKAHFNVELAKEAVAPHRDKVSMLNPPSGRVLDDDTFRALASAWERLRQSGRAVMQTSFQRSWICPLPPMAKIDDIVPDAMGVLSGDPLAVARFRDHLESILARSAGAVLAPSGGRELSRPGARRTRDDEWSRLEKLLEQRLTSIRRVGPRFLSQDTTVALASAAILVGGQDEATVHRYVGAVLGQLCPLMKIAPAVNAARDVLEGRPGAIERFEGRLRNFWGECGPDDGPLPPWPTPEPGPFPEPEPCPQPWPPDPVNPALPYHPEILEIWLCSIQILRILSQIHLFTYTVVSISPLRACPRDVVTITGTGFGNAQGAVLFQSSGGGTVAGNVTSWTDTQVTVQVPGNATCGPIQLKVLVKTIRFCGRVVHVYKRGLGYLQFDGGLTRLVAVSISGTYGPQCAEPGRNIAISWTTCNANSVDLDVRASDGTVLIVVAGLAPSGTRIVAMPAWTTTRQVTVTLMARGPCGTDQHTRVIVVQARYALSIDGMELTQAIQYYRSAQHLTDPNDQGPDNSLRLVVGKGALLRVYLRSGQSPGFANGDLPNVTGTVTVERRVLGTWNVVGTIAPLNAPFIARDSYASYDAERGTLANSLNFAIPAATMTGMLRFTVNVNSSDACAGGSAQATLVRTINLQQTLNVRAVAIGYQGPDLSIPPNQVNFPAPTAAAITADLGFALATYPVQANPTVNVIANVNAAQPLNGVVPPGGCDPAWGPIMNQVANARTNDGNLANAVYYGWVTANIPRAHGNVGCSGGAAAGLIGAGQTVAHEIGHQFGLAHAPCGQVGTANNQYPNYEPYDPGTTVVNAAGNTVWQSASTGEYGVDTNTLTVFNPQTANDFMSYCGPRWVSIYTHNFLLNQARLGPVAVAAGASSDDGGGVGMSEESEQPGSLITIIGTVLDGEKVRVEGVSRVVALMPRAGGPRTELVAELHDHDGRLLASAPVFAQLPHEGAGSDCACGEKGGKIRPPYRFQAVLGDAARGARIAIRRGEQEVWSRNASKVEPRVENLRADVSKAGVIGISWESKSQGEVPAESWVRWSPDGKEWSGLAVGITEDKLELPASSLPAQSAWFEVRLNDGFETVSARVGPVTLAKRPATLAVISPAPGAKLLAGPVHLMGVVLDKGSQDLDIDKAQWTSEKGVVARGMDAWISADPGHWSLELHVPGANPASVAFDVLAHGEK